MRPEEKSTLLTFIGMGDYKKGRYELDGRVSEFESSFAQVAILDLFADSIGSATVFMTEESRRKNYEGEEGLRCWLEKVAAYRGMTNFSIKEVLVPPGRNKEESMEIFRILSEEIGKGESLIVDVTHGFRSFPVLLSHLTGYLKAVKGVKVERVLYGAFEAAEDKCSGVYPMFDLTPFVTFHDWAVGIDRYLSSGSGRHLKSLGVEALKPFLMKEGRREGMRARSLLNALDTFSKNVATCRGPLLRENVRAILSLIDEAEDEVCSLLPQFEPIFRRIREEFIQMNVGDPIRFDLQMAGWCAEKGLIQQGYTIFAENLISHLLVRVFGGFSEEKVYDYRNREEARKILNACADGRDKSGSYSLEKSGGEYHLVGSDRALFKNVWVPLGLVEMWKEVSGLRNDINHGGNRSNPAGADTLSRNLKSLIDAALAMFG